MGYVRFTLPVPASPSATVATDATVQAAIGQTVANVATVAEIAPNPDELERAAIIEEGAKVPREWAEGFAKLCLAPPPAGVSPARWRSVIDGAGHFLDRWAGAAHALGWTAAELFGLDPVAPLNRRDRRGAAFFAVGHEVIAVTADEIAFRQGRAVTRLRRRPMGAAPAWVELKVEDRA